MNPVIYNTETIVRMMLIKKYISMILIVAVLAGCEGFVTVDAPITEVVSSEVFADESAATSAISGIYSQMITNNTFTKGGIELYTGLSSDELINYSNQSDEDEFFMNNLAPQNVIIQNVFWGEAYKYINNANVLIEGLKSSTTIRTSAKNQLLGEALFIRAFCHFYLVNLFGDVPYIETTDFEQNAVVMKQSPEIVYGKIIADLVQAKGLMFDDFAFANYERVRPNKVAATALLSRVYLYSARWEEAERESTEVIEGYSDFMICEDLTTVFQPNSTESIWQLKPSLPGDNTPQGDLFILDLPPDGSARKVSLSDTFYESFDPDDKRKSNWIGVLIDEDVSYYFSYKYKERRTGDVDPLEYSTVLRVGEQYLIRAEARANLNKLNDAISDVDVIRARAGISKISDINPAVNKLDLLNVIYDERKYELFTEWGHRWLDLKRTLKASIVLSNKNNGWDNTDELYPIPQSEILNNSNLLPQNNGY